MVRDSVKTKAGRRKGKRGARWQKGQSCVSNPQTTKYRDEASSAYYHQVRSNPLLTASNLQSAGLGNDDDIEDDVLSEDIQSLTVSDARSLGRTSIGSYKSFASDWSKCSNKAFERFLTKCKLDSAIHKDMLSILAATSEIINTMGGTHKETEYFASFVTGLDKCEREQYHPMLALLAIIIGKIPKPILRKKFVDFYPKIGAILEEAMDSHDSVLIRLCCDILRKCIAVQDPSVIESERPIQNLVYSILKCAVHDNPKVRKKARWAICFIMEEQNNMDAQAITYLVVGWVLDQLASYPACGAKTVVDALSLLQHVWSNIKVIPSNGAKKLFESVLRVMSSGDISILKIGFMFFVTTFQTGSVTFSVPSSANTSPFIEGLHAKLVTAVWEFKPNWKNEEVFVNWLQCVLNGLVKLSFEDAEIGQKYLPLVLDTVSLTWSASFGLATSKILVDFLPHLINAEMPVELFEKSFQIFSKNLITLPPNQNCLFVLSKFLECVTPTAFCESGKEVLTQLIPLRTMQGVENILRLFVSGFGVENVWKSVEPEIQRTILLPLLRGSASNEKFQFWGENILTLLTPDTGNNPSLKFLIWDSFVGFCKNPADPANFPAELLGKTIVGMPEVRLSTLAALRQILKWDQAKPITTKYSVNYLPILFNLYVKEKCAALSKKAGKDEGEDMKVNDGHAEAVATTVQEYLPQCKSEFILELTQKALKKYTEAPNDFEKSALLDLLTFLLGVQSDENMLEEGFSIASKFINDSGQMKRAYRLLVVLIKNDNVPTSIKTKIAGLLRENKGKTKSNAQAFRLECITTLAFQDDAWFTEFLPEAILNLLSVNMKARKSAAKFISSLVDQLKEKGATLDNMMDIINLGLSSSTSFTCACTIHFLSLIYRPMMPPSPPTSLMNQCIGLVLEKKDSTVTMEAFKFISLALSLHKGNMGTFASEIGKALAAGGLPRKETNKLLAQLIKIFGVVGLKAILPNSSDPKMHRRIRNIQNKLKKLKDLRREKATQENDEEEEDYTDEVLDSWTGKTKGSKQDKLLMKEDLVDFLDPHNITASLISKPKEAKQEDQFEMSADGKLIIQEKSGQDMEELDSDDEGEYNELFKKPELSRKRKFKSSGSTTSRRSTRSHVSSLSRGSAKGTVRGAKSAVSVKSGAGGHIKGANKPNAKRRKLSRATSSVRSSRF